MSSDDTVITAANPREPWWPWLLFGLAACWVVLIRAPLILNADRHLDSDLAVDGLTLLEATQGHWRWHYPGTPYMGIAPVLLSWPQAMLFGTSPTTLVSGGTVAYLGLLLGTFLLARSAFGHAVAAWALVPLAFASNGAVWLSGRITGGHLPAAAWHAGAFALLVPCLRRGGWPRALALGIWCGLGVSLDSMFLVTLAGLIPAAALFGLRSGATRTSLALAVVFVSGLAVGLGSGFVGARIDPHNAYEQQFGLVNRGDVLLAHADILVRKCLPRLFAGHQLPDLETDPSVAELSMPFYDRPTGQKGLLPYAATALGLGLWAAAMIRLAAASLFSGDATMRAVTFGLLVSGIATAAAFVTNRNIFNSDNYRYLVTLLVAWAIGFGLLMNWLCQRGSGGRILAALVTIALAVVMTEDLARWYHGFGWLDSSYRPVHNQVDDPILKWLEGEPAIEWIEGGYWDVYRLCFLSSGRLRGAPFPIYPNRFPEWRPSSGAGRAVVVRATPEGAAFRESALRAGGRIAGRARGATLIVLP